MGGAIIDFQGGHADALSKKQHKGWTVPLSIGSVNVHFHCFVFVFVFIVHESVTIFDTICHFSHQ